ncbi:MAG TPA: energy-coupling factor transporter transmembrane protein EcfT, partial [Bacillota bacterium]|nr:energy-coupling factor transporter transmembrane protein EcfT [Bacillota bacterium]
MMNYLGQYQPGNSVWHRADPRSKLAVTVVTVLSLFICEGIEFSIPLTVIIVLYLTARLPLKLGWRVLIRFKWLLFITLLANWVGTDWAKDYEQFLSVFDSLFKLISAILAAVWLSYVSKPFALVDGLAKCLQPLQVLRLPVSDIALAVGLVSRFIP